MGRARLSVAVAERPQVVVDDLPVTVADIVAVANGAPVDLGATARARIVASRAIVDRLASGSELVYGLNTGLGHMRNERVPVAELVAGQATTLRLHAGGIGPPLPKAVVRAAMAVRLAGFARGGSGVSAAVAEMYVQLLNAGVTPIVPEVGSVGAADLGHLAHIALVAIGEGRAEVDGEVLPGMEALKRAALLPVALAPKDGLTLISANGVSVGQAALVVDRASALADAADIVAALSLESTRGNLSIVDPLVAGAKPVPGQQVVAARILRLVGGSALLGQVQSVQDPLSFRVVPQVHGAFREVVGFARDAVEGELAGMGDNPLVSLADGRMISNGNFHPMLMALAMDAVRPAAAHVGQLSDRRVGHIWDRMVSDPDMFAPGAIERFGNAPLLRYSGAARTAELRTLADPASLDVGPLDLGVEDHATNAALVVRRTGETLDLLADVLAVELLVAAAALAWTPDARSAARPAMQPALDLLAGEVPQPNREAASDATHRAARDLLLSPRFRALVTA